MDFEAQFLGLAIERDIHFIARGPISKYIDAAFAAERIVEIDHPDGAG